MEWFLTETIFGKGGIRNRVLGCWPIAALEVAVQGAIMVVHVAPLPLVKNGEQTGAGIMEPEHEAMIVAMIRPNLDGFDDTPISQYGN